MGACPSALPDRPPIASAPPSRPVAAHSVAVAAGVPPPLIELALAILGWGTCTASSSSRWPPPLIEVALAILSWGASTASSISRRLPLLLELAGGWQRRARGRVLTGDKMGGGGLAGSAACTFFGLAFISLLIWDILRQSLFCFNV